MEIALDRRQGRIDARGLPISCEEEQAGRFVVAGFAEPVGFAEGRIEFRQLLNIDAKPPRRKPLPKWANSNRRDQCESLSVTTPAMISETPIILPRVTASPKQAMPMRNVPAAPMPVQTA